MVPVRARRALVAALAVLAMAACDGSSSTAPRTTAATAPAATANVGGSTTTTTVGAAGTTTVTTTVPEASPTTAAPRAVPPPPASTVAPPAEDPPPTTVAPPPTTAPARAVIGSFVEAGVADAVALSHNCAVRADAHVACWMSGSPVLEVPGLTDAIAIDTRSSTDACAVRRTGVVVCWDAMRASFDAASKTTTYSIGTPQQIPAIDNAAGVAVGTFAACAWTTDGAVWCWEPQRSFAGAPRPAPLPVLHDELHDVVQVSVGGQSACARTRAGEVWCWGKGDAGRLGTGTDADADAPVRAPRLEPSAGISVGGAACSLHLDGSATCVGSGDYGATPGAVAPGGVARTKISWGGRVCLLQSDGSVECTLGGFSGNFDQGYPGARGEGPQAELRAARDIVDVDTDTRSLCVLHRSGAVLCQFYFFGG